MMRKHEIYSYPWLIHSADISHSDSVLILRMITFVFFFYRFMFIFFFSSLLDVASDGEFFGSLRCKIEIFASVLKIF